MFETMGRAAENMATRVSLSRRGFLGAVGRWGAVTAMALAGTLATVGKTKAGAGYKCCLYSGYYLGCPSICISSNKNCPTKEQVPGGGKCVLAGFTYVTSCANCA